MRLLREATHRALPCSSSSSSRSASSCSRRRGRVHSYFHVPFGGRSPEATAAASMKNLFTMAAVKIVLAQLEGSSAGRGSSAFGSFNPEQGES